MTSPLGQSLVTCDVCGGIGGFAEAGKVLGVPTSMWLDMYERGAETDGANGPETLMILGDRTHWPILQQLSEACVRLNVNTLLFGAPCQPSSRLRSALGNSGVWEMWGQPPLLW